MALPSYRSEPCIGPVCGKRQRRFSFFFRVVNVLDKQLLDKRRPVQIEDKAPAAPLALPAPELRTTPRKGKRGAKDTGPPAVEPPEPKKKSRAAPKSASCAKPVSKQLCDFNELYNSVVGKAKNLIELIAKDMAWDWARDKRQTHDMAEALERCNLDEDDKFGNFIISMSDAKSLVKFYSDAAIQVS